jgi:hypothetical protein
MNSEEKAKVNNYYRLKVNINGFRLEDVKVSIDEEVANNTKNSNNNNNNKENNGVSNNKLRVKIAASRNIKTPREDTTKEYVKYHDLFRSKSNVDPSTMRYYLDEKNACYLIVEFEANASENVYVNLDDSCESLVELAARSLLNVKNLDNLKNMIQNPFTTSLEETAASLEDVFSPTLIQDLNLATRTKFTPIKMEADRHGNKKIRLDVAMPNSMNAKGIKINYTPATEKVVVPIKDTAASSLVVVVDKKNKNPTDAERDEESINCINLRVNGLKLDFEAITSSADTTSSYSKQFHLPKGTLVDQLSYSIDESKHSLVVEAPFSKF